MNQTEQSRPVYVSDYPLILTAKHIAKIMDVSGPTAYTIMELPDFPLMKWGGSGKRVGRDAFFRWFNQRSNGGSGVDLERGNIDREFVLNFLQALEEVVQDRSKSELKIIERRS